MRTTTFSLGRLVATPGALAALAESGERPGCFLARHVGGDWGLIDEKTVSVRREAFLTAVV